MEKKKLPQRFVGNWPWYRTAEKSKTGARENIATIAEEAPYRWPNGARGRNFDNQLIRHKPNWSPSTVLIDGLRPTYDWISRQVARNAQEGGEAARVSVSPTKPAAPGSVHSGSPIGVGACHLWRFAESCWRNGVALNVNEDQLDTE